MDDSQVAAGAVLFVPSAEDLVVRQTTDCDRADEWALVLTALGVLFRIGRTTRAIFQVFVAPVERPRASPRWRPTMRSPRPAWPWRPASRTGAQGALGMVLGILLVAFQYVTGLWESAAGRAGSWPAWPTRNASARVNGGGP